MLDCRWKRGWMGECWESNSPPKRNLLLRPVNTQMLGFIHSACFCFFVFFLDSESLRKSRRNSGFWKKEGRCVLWLNPTSDVDGSTGFDFSSRWSCVTFGPSCPRQKENGSFWRHDSLYSINFSRCLHLNHLSRWSSSQAVQWHKSWDCDTQWSTNAWVGVENTALFLDSVTPFADVSIWYFVNSDIKDCGACDAQVEGFLLLPYPKCLGRTSSCIPVFWQVLSKWKKIHDTVIPFPKHSPNIFCPAINTFAQLPTGSCSALRWIWWSL